MTRREVACSLIFSCLACYIVASHSCNETRCQLLVEGVDSSSEFRFKAAEEGVRLVYLYFKISNNSYDYNPITSENKILPYRWAWTKTTSEPLLSLSYDYDVLSLGLLKNQVRGMEVSLKELQLGCLADLNSSCQDIVIANALMSITRNLTSSTLSNERTGVVCFRVLQEYSFGLVGGFKYQCCEEVKHSKENTIYCGLDVKESKWLDVFNAILATVVSVVFFYWPLLLCALPVYMTDHDGPVASKGTCYERQRSLTRKTSEIPVDDLSPITCAMILQKCAENLPSLSHGVNMKLFFLWYCVIPICFYAKLGLYFIIKSNYFDDASRKLLFQVFDYYLNVFSVDRPLVYVLFIFPLFIIPGVIISAWRPKIRDQEINDCWLCRKYVCQVCVTQTPQKEILTHVQVIPQIVSAKLKAFFERFKLQNNHNHSQHSMCGHVVCVLCSVAFLLIVVPLVAMTTVLILAFASIACIIIYSPYVCLMLIIFRLIPHEGNIYKVFRVFMILTIVYSSLSVCIVAIFSCQFVVRMFGFIIMGLTLNAEVTVPYATFAFVVWRNISLCFSNLQHRYKEIKEMISEQWKELKKDSEDTIPTELFWFVCNDSNVIPIANEICAMLWNVVAIIIFLVIALAAIFLFKLAYNLSAVVSTVAVFVSGKMSELFFSGVTTGYNFSGWEKFCKKEMIRSAVEKFTQREKIKADTATSESKTTSYKSSV